MARPCTVCTHLESQDIDLELSGGSTLGAIAKKHQVSTDSLRRHKLSHMTPALIKVAQQRRNLDSAVTVYERLEQLVLRTNKFLDRAERKGALVAGAQLLGQLRQTLETIARISGELQDRPQVNVLNIVADVGWQELRAAMLSALLPFPDARQALVAALTSAHPEALELEP